MYKPANFDSTKASGEFTPITLGGHHLIIKKVEESQTKTGKDMIIVAIDMAPNDSQAGYMASEFASDIRPDKRWPRAGRQYIVVTDDNGNCSRSFKTFISAVERSNSGFTTQWGENFAQQFKGRKIGGVFGEVESEYNGKISMKRELRWFIADDKVSAARAPEPKYLPNHNIIQAVPTTPVTAKDFAEVTDGLEEIPF